MTGIVMQRFVHVRCQLQNTLHETYIKNAYGRTDPTTDSSLQER